MTNVTSIVLFILATLIGPSAFSEEVSFKKIREGYQKNIQSLGVFSLRLYSETRSNAEHCDVLRQRLARIQPAFDKMTLTDQAKPRRHTTLR